MIKKILLSSFFLLSIYSFAQESTASPYSFYGLGDTKFQGTAENKAMAGLGILPDSIHINLQNPASLASLKLTSFTIGGTYNTVSFENASLSEKARRTSLDYLAMAFPVGKLSFSLGLMPYSSVGYNILKFNNNETARYSGKGGVNKVFLGSGYKLSKKWSIGAELSYNFGITDKSSSLLKQIQFGTRELVTSNLSGISLNTGLIFKSKLKKFDIVSSLMVTPGTTITSSNEIKLAKITFDSNGNEVVWDEITTSQTNTKFKLPTKLAFGGGIGNLNKWFLGFETTFQSASNFGSIYNTNVGFENGSKFSLGGYYTPDFNSYSNYFKRITYRGGLRYEKTGLVINKESIKDTALTLGLGIPVSGSLNNINLGLEYGTRGTTNAGLIKENYINISVGISFNDRWFVKRKFD